MPASPPPSAKPPPPQLPDSGGLGGLGATARDALRVVLRPSFIIALLAVALLPISRALRLVWTLVVLPFVVVARLSVSGSGSAAISNGALLL